MPQLDLFSYFSAASTLVFGFLFLVFILHTYFLPKIALALKFRKKILQKQATQQPSSLQKKEENNPEALLTLAQKYVNLMENILKNIFKLC